MEKQSSGSFGLNYWGVLLALSKMGFPRKSKMKVKITFSFSVQTTMFSVGPF